MEKNDSKLTLSSGFTIASFPTPDYRPVDLNKVKTVEDVVNLIQALYPMSTFSIDANHKSTFEKVKHLLKEEPQC